VYTDHRKNKCSAGVEADRAEQSFSGETDCNSFAPGQLPASAVRFSINYMLSGIKAP
jgi:hypothetical protein